MYIYVVLFVFVGLFDQNNNFSDPISLHFYMPISLQQACLVPVAKSLPLLPFSSRQADNAEHLRIKDNLGKLQKDELGVSTYTTGKKPRKARRTPTQIEDATPKNENCGFLEPYLCIITTIPIPLTTPITITCLAGKTTYNSNDEVNA